MTLIKIRFIFAKDLHICPSEFDRLEMYEILYILDEYKNWVDEQNEGQSAQQDEANAQVEAIRGTMPDYNRMTSNIAQSVPKVQMPSLPSFSMPSFPK